MRYLLTLPFLLLAALLAAGPAFSGSTVSSGNPNPPVVTKFLDLFERLHTAQEKNSEGDHQKVSFRLNETEVNEYMRYALKTTPRPGVDSITVKFFPKDYI